MPVGCVPPHHCDHAGNNMAMDHVRVPASSVPLTSPQRMVGSASKVLVPSLTEQSKMDSADFARAMYLESSGAECNFKGASAPTNTNKL